MPHIARPAPAETHVRSGWSAGGDVMHPCSPQRDDYIVSGESSSITAGHRACFRVKEVEQETVDVGTVVGEKAYMAAAA